MLVRRKSVERDGEVLYKFGGSGCGEVANSKGMNGE